MSNIQSTLPRHVAIIMDGNGRWAKKRLLPRIAGHRAGTEAVRRAVRFCAERRIEALTLFAFSSENWRRPRDEVGLLMQLFARALQRELQRLHQNNVRLRVIGDTSAFSKELQKLIQQAEATTANNSGLNLIVAANYGGHWDIAQAAQQLATQVQAGHLSPTEITAERLSTHLCLADLPEPDLFIRTGGEQRISNFLLWQLAYTELYFTDTLWPDFNEQVFIAAVESYAQRQRRFGRTGDQVEGNA